MPTYTVDPNLAYSICDEMNQVQMTIKDRLEQQATQVQSVLADWEDDAKQEYQARKQEWEQIAANMPATLAIVRSRLTEIVDGYVQTTRQGASTWSGYSAR